MKALIVISILFASLVYATAEVRPHESSKAVVLKTNGNYGKTLKLNKIGTKTITEALYMYCIVQPEISEGHYVTMQLKVPVVELRNRTGHNTDIAVYVALTGEVKVLDNDNCSMTLIEEYNHVFRKELSYATEL